MKNAEDAPGIGTEPEFRLGKIDSRIGTGVCAGQVLCDGSHTVPGSGQHRVHVPALNVDFDAETAGQSFKDAYRLGKRHRIGKTR